MVASKSGSYGDSWMPSAVSVIERLSPSLTRRRAATSLGRIAPRELPIFLTLTLNMTEGPPVAVITYVTTKREPMSNGVEGMGERSLLGHPVALREFHLHG